MKWIIRIGVIMFAVFCGIKAVPEEKAILHQRQYAMWRLETASHMGMDLAIEKSSRM